MEDQPTKQSSNNNTTTSSENSSISTISSTTTSTATTSSRTERNNTTSGEPVRSRWTPKPEQILILESIFNSGMVNPPKEETVRIRKLLEKFGAVGDANVFYWFQNRRSRSRRRQRQLQASLAASVTPVGSQTPPPPPVSMNLGLLGGGGGSSSSLYDFGHHHHHHHQNSIISTCTTQASSSVTCFSPSNTSTSSTNFGDCGGVVDDAFGNYSGQMGLINSNHHLDCPSSSPNLEFQSGIITVFLNGVATQVPDGALDMKAMFGEEVILVHSSGVPVPFNEYGISLQSLQHGESYFLVCASSLLLLRCCPNAYVN
ncbi:WUSCHEL-related homeobox 11-like [Chenopodium quinoa]|uniref:WUSCHEL-related homeobox 11-like n=1 Tax=Chenopodium quinoa TaxID=63459 RepID=UPI000B7851A4|nr:WUSCHEL-related homeobox 11-like [Chenopodium quinoa]